MLTKWHGKVTSASLQTLLFAGDTTKDSFAGKGVSKTYVQERGQQKYMFKLILEYTVCFDASQVAKRQCN